MSLHLQVLGALRGHRDGMPLDLGTPQQRMVLAVLLAAAGEPVGLAAIADVLWPEATPPAAAATIHQYVSRLRRIIDPGRPARDLEGPIRRTSSGYQVVAGETAVDALHWRALVARGRAESSVSAYAAAADLWSGPVAADLPPRSRAHALFADLNAEHARVLVEAADLALEAGQAKLLADPLTAAVAWHPLDEVLHARLIRVLDAAGRREEALVAYATIRDRLGAELGPLLQAAAPPVPAAGRPAQLPNTPATFSGRHAELALIDRAQGPRALVIVGGLGGVGKTSLALRWAHRAASGYPDGQLYVDLSGFAPRSAPLRPADALHGFLEALGVPRAHQPSALDGLTSLYRSSLADRRMLVVLDNARDEKQVRPLLPGTTGCAVLVTSRNRLGGLVVEDGAVPINLDVFGTADADRYLRLRLGDERVSAEPGAVAQIIEICGGLPLALAICAAWAERSPAFTLAGIAAELTRRRGLDAFVGVAAGRDVRAVFSWSYQRLSPETAQLFRRLAWHPGADVALATAVSIAGRSRTETLALLAELADTQLLTELRPGRYASHDLVRTYAAEMSDDGDDEAEAVRRALDHYVHSLVATARLANPYRRQLDAGRPAEGVVPDKPGEVPAAVEWFEAERENLRAALDVAAARGLDDQVLLLCWGMNGFLLDLLGRWDEAIPVALRALEAARRKGESWWIGYLHNVLGNCCHKVGRHDEAYRHWESAAAVGREIDDPVRTAIGLSGMATSLTAREDWPDADRIERAADCADQIRELLADIDRAAPPGRGDPTATHARELLGLSYEFSALRVLQRTGDVAAAVAERIRGIDVHRGIGSRPRIQHGWQSIGRLQEHVGDFAEAARAYGRALALVENDEWIGAELPVALARCHLRLGDHDAAAGYRARALHRLEGVYHPPAERLRAELDAADR